MFIEKLPKYFSPLKGYSPVRGNVCDSRQKGARFRRKRCHEVTEGFQPLNNNLPPDFLLGHSDKPIPEPYPGSGVALRQTIIWRYTSGRAMRAPTVTYIRTDIIICKLPDTDKSLLRTAAFPHRSVNLRPLLTSNI